MKVYARQGDTIEAICYRHLKQTANVTEQVLELNPTLAAIGPTLPEGTLVILPDSNTTTPTKQITQLWD